MDKNGDSEEIEEAEEKGGNLDEDGDEDDEEDE